MKVIVLINPIEELSNIYGQSDYTPIYHIGKEAKYYNRQEEYTEKMGIMK